MGTEETSCYGLKLSVDGSVSGSKQVVVQQASSSVSLKYIRVIPRLDIKGPNLVKGVHLEGLRTLGRPEEFASYYYEQGADELIFQDVVASLYQRNSLIEVISRTARNIFIPLTVGGGLRTLEDINTVLRAGADKVSINTAAVERPDFIDEASRVFGSSTIVVAVEVSKQPDGEYLAFTDNGREYTGIEAISWIKEVEDRGAGEILITSIDREGTGRGFDCEFVRLVTDVVRIPVVAHGGAANSSHINDVVTASEADAVSVASMLHYPAVELISSNPSDEEGNREFLRSNNSAKLFLGQTLPELKNDLAKRGLNVRETIK